MITLSRAIDGFLLHKRASGRSPYTLRNYTTQLERLCKWLEDPEINKITSEDLAQFFVYLREEYRIQRLGKLEISPRPLSAKTRKNAWGTLSIFWRWASSEFDIENPFDVAPVKYHPVPIQPFTKEEIEKLLSACDETARGSKRSCQVRDRTMIYVFLDTGIRVSELTGADIEDCDLEAGRLLVAGKGSKSRFVYLGLIARRSIWKYLSHRFPSEKPPGGEPLFVHRDGIHRLTRHGVRGQLRKLGERAGVANVYPHRFRHTFAIQFLRNGGDIFSLQQLLGHSSLDMVRRYVALAEMDMEGAHRRASPADNWQLR